MMTVSSLFLSFIMVYKCRIKILAFCLLLVVLNAYRGNYISKQLTVDCNITIRGCMDCNPLDASKCHMCTYNFTLNTNNFTCDCQKSYYLNQNKTQCLVCMDLFGLNCKNCSSSSIDNSTYCIQCQAGYYWNTMSCCSNNAPNCSNCSFDGTQCFACVNGSYFINGTCYSCQQECLICQNGQCTQCKDNQTYIQNGTCMLCEQSMTGCKVCSDGSTCTGCVSLQYYLSGGTCTRCNMSISNCTQCSSASSCLSCQVGSVLSITSSSCILCSSLFSDCLKCSSVWDCQGCIKGKQFRNGACITPSANSGMEIWWIILICVAVAIIIGIVVCCIIKKRKDKLKQSIIDSDNNSKSNDNNLSQS